MDSHERADLTASDDERWALLDRFLAGECTGEEAHEVRAWLAADPERRVLLETTRRIREIASDRPPMRSADAAWKRAVDELGLGPDAARVIELPEPAERAPFEVLTQRPRWRFVPAIAKVAAVLGLVAGGAALWQMQREAAPAAAPQAFAQYVTQRGQRLSVRLADGTLVLLAPGSTLWKPSTYGVGARTLYLEGEAYFDVAHDSTNPFTVRTAGAVARDLGTRFVVRAYAGDSTTDVVVTDGAVVLQAGTSALLTAGQLGQAAPGGNVTVRPVIDLDRYVAWTEGRLVFRDAPFRDVVRQLARWYDIDIRFRDSVLGARRLTASFDDQPVTEIFDKMAGPVGFDVERDGRVYTLNAR